MKDTIITIVAILIVIGCVVFGPSLFFLMVSTAFYMAFLALCQITPMWWLAIAMAAVNLYIRLHNRRQQK